MDEWVGGWVDWWMDGLDDEWVVDGGCLVDGWWMTKAGSEIGLGSGEAPDHYLSRVKLLLFSDLHTSTSAATRMVELSRRVDVVVGAGDSANARHGISTCIEVLAEINLPVVLVPGNNESHEELLQACAQWPTAQVLHGTSAQVGGIAFFGIGGGIPVTPFGDWSWDFSEAQASRLLEACPAGTVLVSHSPPKGFVDESGSGRSLGSTAVRDAIIRVEPRLVVCGHIHACGGQSAQLGRTPIVNAGPGGVLFELG